MAFTKLAYRVRKYFYAHTHLMLGSGCLSLLESRIVTKTKLFFQCALQKIEDGPLRPPLEFAKTVKRYGFWRPAGELARMPSASPSSQHRLAMPAREPFVGHHSGSIVIIAPDGRADAEACEHTQGKYERRMGMPLSNEVDEAS
ncbi:MAG TPA: hypothetical protein PLN33_14135 [Hyphomonadaceae bacterium]|nr:hypothetical protein [Hyphomonadaceae bacterium]